MKKLNVLSKLLVLSLLVLQATGIECSAQNQDDFLGDIEEKLICDQVKKEIRERVGSQLFAGLVDSTPCLWASPEQSVSPKSSFAAKVAKAGLFAVKTGITLLAKASFYAAKAAVTKVGIPAAKASFHAAKAGVTKVGIPVAKASFSAAKTGIAWLAKTSFFVAKAGVTKVGIPVVKAGLSATKAGIVFVIKKKNIRRSVGLACVGAYLAYKYFQVQAAARVRQDQARRDQARVRRDQAAQARQARQAAQAAVTCQICTNRYEDIEGGACTFGCGDKMCLPCYQNWLRECGSRGFVCPFCRRRE